MPRLFERFGIDHRGSRHRRRIRLGKQSADCLFGTVIKGWNDFKTLSLKIDMCRFAYTTYDKTLIELRTYVRGLPMEEFEGFLIKMQTLDDTITDFTLPVSDKCVQEYKQRFRYDNVDKSRSTLV